ncbi:MAG: hypothetical protein DMF89_06485 [Acidobacteria bacterium]|nr:MAG: hypothetical protein DMF90_06495 [Acidobacteriota bacterium]PYR51349.1 MAG: hypothetical protein DMF89_06485 [Acidobacteriota bacterium]
MRRTRGLIISLLGACLLMLGAAVGANAASFIDPALRFRTLRTAHFAIHFHQGEEGLAARLGAIAESVWLRMRDTFHRMPPRVTEVILADQSEVAAGWATPIPYNTIYITPSAPAGSEYIGRTDDWLRLVFTHEFTHIMHLDWSAGWARVFHGLFGRTVLAFPNLFLPTWQVEGLATWAESTLAGEGRLHAGDFRAIVREAALTHRVEPLDRINGGLADWPAGLAPYAYGAGLHEYLADQFGEEALAQLAKETARSLPYLGSRAFRTVFGESLGSLWRRYVSSLEGSVAIPADTPGFTVYVAPSPPERLTHHGHVVLGPRFAPAPCSTCSQEIIYSIRSPHGFPALRRIEPNGSGALELTTRYLGSTTAQGREHIVFDQQELRRNAGLYSDLFAYDRRGGHVRQLTREARLKDPDLSPDGRMLVCVREGRGSRELVLVPFMGDKTGPVSVLLSEVGTQFDAPRWSPDGRTVVVERHRPNRLSDIVVVEVQTGSVSVVADDLTGRFVTPTWRPDGRAIVAAGEFRDRPFNLYELSLDEPRGPARQLTATTGGAIWPDVSADGRTIVFVGYTPEGFDLFTVPYPPRRLAADLAPAATYTPGLEEPPPIEPLVHTPDPRTYSPWSTLRPTAWTPVFSGAADQLRLGPAVSGTDVLARHSYSVTATWLVTTPDGLHAPNRSQPDWQVAYAYARFRPTLFLSASSETTLGAGAIDASGHPSSTTLRERTVQAGVFVPFTHVRTDSRALLSVVAGPSDYIAETPQGTLVQGPALDRTSVRAGWSTNTVHVYSFSISPERGILLGTTAELTREALGAAADATVFTADLRAYLPGAADHHVIALRAAGGSSTGSRSLGRLFHLGGARAAGDVLDFRSDAISLLRGFPSDAFAGPHVALVNTEYRWPLARPQRGAGTWPVFLQTLSATLFADAGHAWTTTFRGDDAKISAGAELGLDLAAGYSFPISAAIGVAWGRNGARPVERGATLYVRFGRSF